MTEKDVIHHFEFQPAKDRMTESFDRIRVSCPHCQAKFWLEADEWGGVREGRHCCRTGSWELVPRDAA